MSKDEVSMLNLKNESVQHKHFSGLFSRQFEGLREESRYCKQTHTNSALNVLGCILPLRFSGLPIKRKLTRMTLLPAQVQFCSEQHSEAESPHPSVTDYIRSLMDIAISRGELRFRAADEMVRYYLSLTSELNGHFTTNGQPDVCLRSQMRRRISQDIHWQICVCGIGMKTLACRAILALIFMLSGALTSFSVYVS